MKYKPLPNSLTISRSSVDGLGLFAVTRIPAGTVLGCSHVRDDRFSNNFIRTPLGGFINHSDNPNVEKISAAESRQIEGDLLMLRTLKEINSGEELFTKYNLYDINDNNDNIADIDIISGTEDAYLRVVRGYNADLSDKNTGE
tara:strand:+ start:469 stop:897 length:429 start_codon:yes stop_codon:yes gene_type:complete